MSKELVRLYRMDWGDDDEDGEKAYLTVRGLPSRRRQRISILEDEMKRAQAEQNPLRALELYSKQLDIAFDLIVDAHGFEVDGEPVGVDAVKDNLEDSDLMRVLVFAMSPVKDNELKKSEAQSAGDSPTGNPSTAPSATS